MFDAEGIMLEISNRHDLGWDASSQLQIVCDFLNTRNLAGQFQNYVEDRARDELGEDDDDEQSK